MTRKDYVLLAEALAEARTENCGGAADRQHARDCAAVADALARENARFDRARFLKACGVQS